MQTQFSNIFIRGIAAALPKHALNLNTLGAKFGEIEVKRIIASTGIQSVRTAQKDTKCSDLCAAAALTLFEQLSIAPDSVDAIILVSQTPDYAAPATSAVLQHRLGLSNNTVAFDINYGCSGYIYGLYQAAMLLNSGSCQRVLLCAGDVITPLLHPEDRQVRMVLADAGSATLIEKGEDDIAITLKTDGSGAEYLIAAKNSFQTLIHNPLLDGYFHMNGAKVMEFALREVPPIIDKILQIKNWSKEQVGTFALHQPNRFMLDYLRKKAKLPVEAMPIAVEQIGNTGPASIPVLLSVKSQELKQQNRLEKVVMCGFGVGLSWGAASCNLAQTCIIRPIEV